MLCGTPKERNTFGVLDLEEGSWDLLFRPLGSLETGGVMWPPGGPLGSEIEKHSLSFVFVKVLSPKHRFSSGFSRVGLILGQPNHLFHTELLLLRFERFLSSPAEPPEPPEPAEVVSASAAQSLPSTRAGG